MSISPVYSSKLIKVDGVWLTLLMCARLGAELQTRITVIHIEKNLIQGCKVVLSMGFGIKRP
jgi:hypothetical protein